jgi:hypothetical protein
MSKIIETEESPPDGSGDMAQKGWMKSFIEPLREKYQQLETVKCPYINDLVHFNS